MALTVEEETKIKKMIADTDKTDAADVINKTAYIAITAKKVEIQAIEDKRVADIAALTK